MEKGGKLLRLYMMLGMSVKKIIIFGVRILCRFRQTAQKAERRKRKFAFGVIIVAFHKKYTYIFRIILKMIDFSGMHDIMVDDDCFQKRKRLNSERNVRREKREKTI
jgi:hypothetical protein